jgi:L-malate glycosyltransferase
VKLLVVSHSCATAINQELFAELALATGWKVHLVIPARWKDEFGNRLDQPAWKGLDGGVRKVPVVFNGNIILHAYRMRWRRFLREEKFDAVYVNHEPYAVATWQIARACQSMPESPVLGFYSCQNIAKRYPWPFRSMESTVYRQGTFAFPITSTVAEVLSNKGYGGVQTVLPLPLNPQRYQPQSLERSGQVLPRKEGEIVIGYVGRIVEEKGLRTLARSLGQITDLSWKLVLIGKGEFETELRNLFQAGGFADRTQFLGFVPHVETAGYLSAFDLLVVPSETQPNWKEQFGRVITEAMACCTPVVGSDSGEIPHLIRTSGGGRTFPERDAQALAGVLRELLADSDQRERLGRVGRDWVLAHASTSAVIQTMTKAIECAVQTWRSR